MLQWIGFIGMVALIAVPSVGHLYLDFYETTHGLRSAGTPYNFFG